MHFGLMMECDYREGASQEEAFEEAFAQVEAAETLGLDGIWLAERHFAAPYSAAPIPSIASVPLIMASAIAARTSRMRIGIAVNVLPLSHPIRMAEEAATVDNISQGRFEFGVGRSAFARAYEGYGTPYSESQERFQECLEVIVRAWSNERFSYQGNYYNFDNVCVLPKPYQKPYPPIRIAATGSDTFPRVGSMGYPIFASLREMNQTELASHLKVYREAWRDAGHPGEGDVILRVPVYVAETAEGARSETEVSTMRSYQRMGENFARALEGAGTAISQERAELGRRLSTLSFEEISRDRVAYGTPGEVVERLRDMKEQLQLSGVIAEMNLGGLIPCNRILDSLRLFAQRVVPEFQ